jgi:hypothetical protein
VDHRAIVWGDDAHAAETFRRALSQALPVCKQEAHEESGTAVHRFGKWYCSEMHADLYELKLYEAPRTVHCRHVGCHGAHVPLPEAVGIACSPWQNPVLACFEEDRQP